MDSKDLNQLTSWADDMYRFVITIMDYMKQPRDYGTGEILNMVEMHTISMIAETPGLCVSDIAKRWNRTLSAASRNVDRLYNKGYIEKRKLEGNSKNIHLYVTEKGQQLADLHHTFDLEESLLFMNYIVEKYSLEDLEKCNSIMNTLAEFFEEKP